MRKKPLKNAIKRRDTKIFNRRVGMAGSLAASAIGAAYTVGSMAYLVNPSGMKYGAGLAIGGAISALEQYERSLKHIKARRRLTNLSTALARKREVGKVKERSKENPNSQKLVKVDATTVRGPGGKMHQRRAHYRKVK